MFMGCLDFCQLQVNPHTYYVTYKFTSPAITLLNQLVSENEAMLQDYLLYINDSDSMNDWC